MKKVTEIRINQLEVIIIVDILKTYSSEFFKSFLVVNIEIG